MITTQKLPLPSLLTTKPNWDENLPSFQAYSFMVWITTTNRRTQMWKRSRTSLQDICRRLFLSNFLKTAPFSSTNWKIKKRIQRDDFWSCTTIMLFIHYDIIHGIEKKEEKKKNLKDSKISFNQILTLFEITIVNKPLLSELMATLSVRACSRTMVECKAT